MPVNILIGLGLFILIQVSKDWIDRWVKDSQARASIKLAYSLALPAIATWVRASGGDAFSTFFEIAGPQAIVYGAKDSNSLSGMDNNSRL